MKWLPEIWLLPVGGLLKKSSIALRGRGLEELFVGLPANRDQGAFGLAGVFLVQGPTFISTWNSLE